MGAGVKPCKSTLQGQHLQLLLLEVHLVDGGDFQLATGAGLDVLGYLHHAVGIEVEAHDGVVGLRMGGLLLDAQAVALLVELGHSVALGVVHPVAEDGGVVVLLGVDDGLLQHAGESAAVEDVVAQYQTDAVVADELLADDEGLCQTVG